MKPKINLLIILAFLIGSTGSLYSQNAEQQYQKGLMQEEGEGNLQEAINIYNQIAQNQNADISIRAKALLHVGLCYEKMGKEEATKAYQKLVNNFPSQKSEVAIARERLSKLILGVEEITKTPLNPKFTKIKIPTELSWNVALSPNGKDLALVSDKKLWRIPLSGNLGQNIPGTPIQINTNEIEVEWSGLSWSGDGRWIAFNESPSQDEHGNYEKNRSSYMVSSNGGNPKKIITNFRGGPVVNYRLGLSPNGEKLAFSSIEGEKQFVQTFSGEGGNPKKITEMQSREPVFSPDGRLIAFVEDKNLGRGQGGLGLWIAPAQGGNPQLVAKAGKASSPVWSPNGNKIAFLDYTQGTQINIVPVSKNGEATKEVTKINAPEGTKEIRLLAGWTPDNKIGALLIAKQEFGLYTLPAKGGQAALILNDTYALQPRFSPNGGKIYYTANVEKNNQLWQRRGIAVVSTEGGKGSLLPRNIDSKILVPLGFQSGNRVSPDGKMIISAAKLPNDSNFTKNFPTTQIWKIPIDGSKPIKITNPRASYTDGSPCWSPDGKKVAFVRVQMDESGMNSFKPAGIYTVNSTGGDEEFLNSTSALSISWSPNGKMIAYLHQEDGVPTNNTLNVINVSNGESRVVGKIPGEYSVHVNIELAWSPNSKQIAFNDLEHKVIKVMSLSDGSIEDISTGLVDVSIHHLDWSPNGERFVFGGMKGGNAEFWFLEDFLPLDKLAQKSEKKDLVIRKFMEGTGSEFYGAPSPDGKYFAFVDYKTSPNDIVIKDIETEKETRLSNHPNLSKEGDNGTPYNTIWSPDSRQLAYVWENDKDNFYELRVINVNNPKPETLYRVSYNKGWIKTEDWSSDGKQILVQLTENNQNQLGLISIKDGSFQLLKRIGKTDPYSTKLSPDGKYIAYDNPANEENEEHDIFIIQIDGKKETRLTSHPAHDYLLDWSTSGKEIFFASDRTGTTDMWSISFNNGSTSDSPKLIAENIGNIKSLGSIVNGSFLLQHSRIVVGYLFNRY